MEGRRLRFPRLNLGGSRATELVMQAEYEWNEARATLLEGRLTPLPPPSAATGFASFTGYTARDEAKTKHSIVALLGRPEGVTDALMLYVAYTPSEAPGRSSAPSLRRERDFLEVAESLGAPRWLSASVDYRFSDKTEKDLWFPLPAPLSGKTARTTIEVRGIRGAMIPADEVNPSYTFILDRPANKDVYLSIRFDLSGPFSVDMPRTLFARADKAVADLVTR